MKLYVSRTTPYGRVVRVVLLESGLDARVQTCYVQTRVPDCVIHAFNPTGKVPTLTVDEDVHLSEARLICQYLDSLHSGAPSVDVNPPLPARQFEGVVTGFLDGVCVWVRELRRPQADRSNPILGQERARVARCLPWFDARPGDIESASRFVQLSLFVAVEFLDRFLDYEDWRARYPALGRWYAGCEASGSVAAMRADSD